MKVLIITEDPTHDPYIAEPVVERILADLGVVARVASLRNPHVSGVDEALNKDILDRIIDAERMVDLFILICDRDCNRRKNDQKAAARVEEHAGKMVACLAVQELEVWMLAVHRHDIDADWTEIRNHCDPKEAFAEPFLARQGWAGKGRLGRGYKRAMTSLGPKWKGLAAVCPEIDQLKEDIRQVLADRVP